MELLWYVIGVGTVIVAYAAIANRMLKLGHVLRDRVLEISELLLVEPTFPDRYKGEIRRIIPHVAKPWLTWILAISILPVMLIRPSTRDGQTDVPLDLSASWQELRVCAMIAVLMNSPLACFLLLVQVMIASFFVSFSMMVDVLTEKAMSLNRSDSRWPHLTTFGGS